MAPIAREDVREVLGSVEDIVVAEIIATGASREELTQAQAWLDTEEAMLNEGRPLPSGRVQELLSILQAVERDRQEPER